ncbi:MAG: hypothetical protein AB1454_05735 [Candidatus Auribacterota bacterium]
MIILNSGHIPILLLLLMNGVEEQACLFPTRMRREMSHTLKINELTANSKDRTVKTIGVELFNRQKPYQIIPTVFH